MARSGDGGGVGFGGAMSRRQLLATAALGTGAVYLGGLRPVMGQSASEPFRFGLIKALTGRVASAYAPFYVGPRIAVDEINAAGGILGRKVEIIDADDEGVPSKDPSLVKSLQESKIDILLGPMGTGNSLSALSVATPDRLISAMGSWGSDVSDPKKYPYHFSFVYNDRVASAMTVDFVSKRLAGKKVAIIQDSFPYSAAVTKSVSSGFADKGLPISGVEVFPNNTPDVKSNMRTLQRTGADVLVLAITLPTNVALVFNALRAIGWYPTMLGYSALMSDPKSAVDNFCSGKDPSFE